MNTVWILNHYAVPPARIGGTRHYCLAKYLVEYNWKAYIVAAGIEHSTGHRILDHHEKYRFELYNNIPFLWLSVPSHSENSYKRIANMLSYTFKSLKRSITGILPKPDAIIGSQVHPFAALAAALLAKRFGIPFIFEVRDLWPQTLIDMGRISENGIFARLLRFQEKYLYKQADSIISLLPMASKYITSLSIPENKIVYIPNGNDLSEFPFTPQKKTNKIFQLMYIGAHGNANGLETLIDAMAILKNRKIKRPLQLRMIGDGYLKVRLIEKAKNKKLENIKFEDPVSRDKISSLVAEADAFVILVRNLPKLYRYGISMNKLFDYMAAARPTIIASNAANNPISDSRSGLTVPPENSEVLATNIEKLLMLPDEDLKEMGRNGRKYVEDYHNYKKLAQKLSSILNRVLLNALN